ncbi:MAG: DUF2271 domain-containing protein [Asticcacaulis sp.]|nr:DUF2271 domain-containing protein [Asticcacaulis sp.]
MISKTQVAWGGALIATVSASAATAGQLTVDIQVPQQTVAEYHKPYVTGWVEDGKGQVQGTVFVWYDVKKRDGGGLKYLKELRSWWRKAGRDLTLPTDGVSGATRAPGRQTVTTDAVVKGLPAGQYSLVIEASREAGGHDLVKLPFAYLPATPVTVSGKGDGELGDVRFTYKP